MEVWDRLLGKELYILTCLIGKGPGYSSTNFISKKVKTRLAHINKLNLLRASKSEMLFVQWESWNSSAFVSPGYCIDIVLMKTQILISSVSETFGG